LICEVDGTGDLARALECGPLAFEPKLVEANLWAMTMDTEASLAEYLRLQLRVPALGRLSPLAHALEFVAVAAPGVREILIVGKLCYDVRQNRYDRIVVDATSSGHVVGQLAAPNSLAELVQVGPIRSQTAWMREILAHRSAAIVVTTPEEMPVVESLELIDRLESETDVRVEAVVANKVLPELFGRSEEEMFEALSGPDSTAVLEDALSAHMADIWASTRLAIQLRRNAAFHLDRLRSALPARLAPIYVPHHFAHHGGMRGSRLIGDGLRVEFGL
jgi:anion-transporting  ArsA/GET3 family ATPase